MLGRLELINERLGARSPIGRLLIGFHSTFPGPPTPLLAVLLLSLELQALHKFAAVFPRNATASRANELGVFKVSPSFLGILCARLLPLLDLRTMAAGVRRDRCRYWDSTRARHRPTGRARDQTAALHIGATYFFITPYFLLEAYGM